MSSERYIIGQEMLQRVDGKGGEAVVDSLRDIAPDFARYLIEFPFGDIYARPGLDLRSREIATIAALTALGNAEPQLKVHIAAGLNVGLTQEEITEANHADGSLCRIPGGPQRPVCRQGGICGPLIA
ncbi:carboxymuconolactone decarboxylase [Klebsiella pneumoniae]|nr:carboxymuconolactone decarboxylase [Klebsiella pneumoniae]